MFDREKALKALDEIVEITRGMSISTFLAVVGYATDIREILIKQEPGWISVKDRLPPKDDTKVLTYGNPVTHWMPLPEPPKEEEEDA